MSNDIHVDFVAGIKDGTISISPPKSFDITTNAEIRIEEQRRNFAKEQIEFTLIEQNEKKPGK